MISRLLFLISASMVQIAMAIPMVSPERSDNYEALNGLRASSAPYISGDTFRDAADFIIDEKRIPFDTDEIKEGDVIFLKVDLIEFFFTKVHPHIKNRYVLITHNGDCSSPGAFAHYLDDPKLIAWFGQNADTSHSKFFPIPIGLANRYWPWGDIDIVRKNAINSTKTQRPWLAYFNVEPTHTDRSGAQEFFARAPWCAKEKRKPYNEYLQDLLKAKFVICPRGNGLDCHRQWEALLMGAIPIIKHSSLDSLFEGLPVLFVNEWSELNREFLKQTYRKMELTNFNKERMFADSWLQKIAAKKKRNNFTSQHHLVFVHLGKTFPSYLEDAVYQANLFNSKESIIVLANQEALNTPHNLTKYARTIPVESLLLSEHHQAFKKFSTLDRNYRESFWFYASERFLYLDNLMQQYNLENIFHVESDNLLFIDLKHYLPSFQNHYDTIAAVFDNDNRCIPSFLYMKNKGAMADLARFFVEQAQSGKNDMEVIAAYKKRYPDKINNLPIIPKEYRDLYELKTPTGYTTTNPDAYSQHIDTFNMFDAAAIGQYLGGIDPRNGPSRPGFINESCLFNPAHLSYSFKLDDAGRKIPYATIKDKTYRINNLHMHCKDLKLFASQKDTESIDVVIPCHSKDKIALDLVIDGIKQYGKNIRRVIVISNEKLTDNAEFFDEKGFPFNQQDVAIASFHGKTEEALGYLNQRGSRIGWIYQQLLKLYAPLVIPNIAENVLLLDADTIFLNDTSFIDDEGFALYNTGTEYHKAYFDHLARLLPNISKIYPDKSGICHHMLIQKNIINDLFSEIKQYNNNIEPWQALCNAVDENEIPGSCLSEYELYFNYIFSHPEKYKVKIRPLEWRDLHFISFRQTRDAFTHYNYVSCHSYICGRV